MEQISDDTQQLAQHSAAAPPSLFTSYLAGQPPPGHNERWVVLPGAMMQWMFKVPDKWLGGRRQVARYGINECYKMDDQKFWERAQTLKSHEKLPPSPTGDYQEFWDRQLAYGRYCKASPEPLSYIRWIVAGRPKWTGAVR